MSAVGNSFAAGGICRVLSRIVLVVDWLDSHGMQHGQLPFAPHLEGYIVSCPKIQDDLTCEHPTTICETYS